MTAFATIGGVVIANGQPGPTGQVLGARQAGPGDGSPAQSRAVARAPATPATTEAISPAAHTAAAPSPTAAPAAASAPPGTPAATSGAQGILVAQTSQRTWRGSLGELRLQVIATVRNTGSTWIRLTRSASSYSVLNRSHRTVAGGVFTAALPELIAPGETGYLVDTLSLAFGNPRDFATSRAHVKASPAAAPQVQLSVPSVSISIGAGRGLRAVGEVRNDGGVTARSVVTGVVVLDSAGRTLAAVYDLTDTPQLDPGASNQFDTEYPGAPPVGREEAAELIGFAFISGD